MLFLGLAQSNLPRRWMRSRERVGSMTEVEPMQSKAASIGSLTSLWRSAIVDDKDK